MDQRCINTQFHFSWIEEKNAEDSDQNLYIYTENLHCFKEIIPPTFIADFVVDHENKNKWMLGNRRSYINYSRSKFDNEEKKKPKLYRHWVRDTFKKFGRRGVGEGVKKNKPLYAVIELARDDEIVTIHRLKLM